MSEKEYAWQEVESNVGCSVFPSPFARSASSPKKAWKKSACADGATSSNSINAEKSRNSVGIMSLILFFVRDNGAQSSIVPSNIQLKLNY